MTHCLITGASGFIGVKLASKLVSVGHEVTCFVRVTSAIEPLRDLGVRVVCGEMGDVSSLTSAVARVEVVYHLAGRTRAFSAKQFADVNVTGCANLARACANKTSPPTLVLVSSVAAGGPSKPGRPRTEVDREAPICHYGRSKLGGERAAAEFANDVPTTIARPPIVFGPGGRDGSVMFRAINRTGWHLVPRRSELPLSLIYIDDLIAVLLILAERGERISEGLRGNDTREPHDQRLGGRGIYYTSDPQPTTYADMGRMAAIALGQRPRVLKVRAGWSYLPAIWGEISGRILRRPALVNFDKLREARATGWVCSADKLQQQLGFITEAPLCERFQETADWYRAAGWL